MNTPRLQRACLLAGDSTGITDCLITTSEAIVGDRIVSENRFLCGDKQPEKAAMIIRRQREAGKNNK